MSAIAAVVRRDGRPAESDAGRMVEAMAARAPHGMRTWAEGQAGLGHGALNATPEATAEHLPLIHLGVAITADARLDNRAELIRELSVPNRAGDGALILAAYERWGEHCPERLLGDFAFAVWDGGRQRLFCACDRFAVKPLFWHRSDRLWAVATEIKALLALEEIPRRLNELRLADFLTTYLDDPESTIYLDVARLPAAHALTIDSRGAQLRRYWTVDGERSLRLRSDREYEEAYRAAFQEAVATRLRSDRPVAAMLSGGLDSSSIVVMARELVGGSGSEQPRLRTVSATFTAPPQADEREYIDAVLRAGGVEPLFVRPEAFGPLDDWPGTAWRGDEPEFVMQNTIYRALYSGAAELGSTAMLNGAGGDDVMPFGLILLTELARRGRWIRLVREARAYTRRANFEPGSLALLREFAISPFLPHRLWLLRQRARPARTGQDGWVSGIPLQADFDRRLGLTPRYRPGPLRRSTRPRLGQSAWLTTPNFTIYRTLEDRLAGLLGVEPRYPFLDSRLAELSMAVPEEQRLRNGYGRDLMRRALRDLLPPEVCRRTDKGLPGIHTGLTLPATGKELMDEVLLGEPGPIGGYVDMAAVRTQYRRCLNGAHSDDWYPVWRVVVAALWLSHARERFALEIPPG
jgi:asparagine synthase (glutamine-hydrolysing)